jgi:Na+-driven multidrug efflux pump
MMTATTTSTTTAIVPIETQKRRLTREFFAIALPAFIQLAAEPLAGLVDTAYLGRLGPVGPWICWGGGLRVFIPRGHGTYWE